MAVVVDLSVRHGVSPSIFSRERLKVHKFCELLQIFNSILELISIYTVLQKYAYIELKQNLLRSITLDIITRLLDNVAFVCVDLVGRFSKDFSKVRGLRSRGFQLQARKMRKAPHDEIVPSWVN